MASLSFNGDPKYIGPGVWFSIHLLAKNATSPSLKTLFKHFLYSLKDDFPCPHCRAHISDFLTNNPIESYWYIKDSLGRDIGLFTYSWMFHNAVNKRLGKKIMDFDTAQSFYYKITPCLHQGCAENNK